MLLSNAIDEARAFKRFAIIFSSIMASQYTAKFFHYESHRQMKTKTLSDNFAPSRNSLSLSLTHICSHS